MHIPFLLWMVRPLSMNERFDAHNIKTIINFHYFVADAILHGKPNDPKATRAGCCSIPCDCDADYCCRPNGIGMRHCISWEMYVRQNHIWSSSTLRGELYRCRLLKHECAGEYAIRGGSGHFHGQLVTDAAMEYFWDDQRIPASAHHRHEEQSHWWDSRQNLSPRATGRTSHTRP